MFLSWTHHGLDQAAFSSPLEDTGEQKCLSFLSHRSLLCFPQALKWHLSPLTIVSWLNVYMQVAYLNDLYEVLLPQYPQHIFIQIAEVSARGLGVLAIGPGAQLVAGGGVSAVCSAFCSSLQLLDLCVLDVGCLEFSYGVLAAAALYHFSSSELMQKVSGVSPGVFLVGSTDRLVTGLWWSLTWCSLQGTSGVT